GLVLLLALEAQPALVGPHHHQVQVALTLGPEHPRARQHGLLVLREEPPGRGGAGRPRRGRPPPRGPPARSGSPPTGPTGRAGRWGPRPPGRPASASPGPARRA